MFRLRLSMEKLNENQPVDQKVIILDENLKEKITQFLKKDSGYSIKTKRTYAQTIDRLFNKHKYINKKFAKKLAQRSNPNQRVVLGLIKKTSDEYDLNIPSFMFQPPRRVPRKPPENIYSIERIREIINCLPDENSKLFFRVIFNVGAGLRISEAIKLMWKDLDWSNWIKNKESYGSMRIKTKRGKYNSLTVPSSIMKELYEKSRKEKIKTRLCNVDGIHLVGYPIEESYIFKFEIKKFEDYEYKYKFEQEDFLDRYVRKVYDQIQTHWIRKHIDPFLGHKFKAHSLRHCVSEDTEILTLNGWKSVNNIKIGEDVFTYNIDKDFIEKDKVKNINKYPFNGTLNKINHKYMNALITCEHKIVTRLKNQGDKEFTNWKLIQYNKLKKNTWQIHHKISSKLNKNEKDTIGVYKAGILGWILSDGSIKRKNSPDITISQSITANEIKTKYIEDLLIKSGIKFSKYVRKNRINNFNGKKYDLAEFRINNGGDHSKGNKQNLHNWIFEYINFNRTPKISKILKLNFEELNELYKCIMLGDGTKKNYCSREYCGQNKKRIELVRILCVLLGNISTQAYKKQNNKIYSRLHIRENSDYVKLSNQGKNFQKEKYNGMVWCPETNNSTFIAKRKDKIFITGNSRATQLLREGVPLAVISKALGHQRLETTMIYLDIDSTEQAKFLSKVENL